MVSDQRDPRPTHPGSPGGLRAIPIEHDRAHPQTKELGRGLSTPLPLLRAWGLARASGSRSTGNLSPVLNSCSAYDIGQGLGTRRRAPCYRCPGAPWHHSLGMPLPTAPPIGSRPGRDTRRQSFPRPPGAQGLPGPCVSPQNQPPLPLRRLHKVSPGGGWSKLTPPNTQSVRTEQPDDAQASLAPRHLGNPRRTTASPS